MPAGGCADDRRLLRLTRARASPRCCGGTNAELRRRQHLLQRHLRQEELHVAGRRATPGRAATRPATSAEAAGSSTRRRTAAGSTRTWCPQGGGVQGHSACKADSGGIMRCFGGPVTPTCPDGWDADTPRLLHPGRARSASSADQCCNARPVRAGRARACSAAPRRTRPVAAAPAHRAARPAPAAGEGNRRAPAAAGSPAITVPGTTRKECLETTPGPDLLRRRPELHERIGSAAPATASRAPSAAGASDSTRRTRARTCDAADADCCSVLLRRRRTARRTTATALPCRPAGAARRTATAARRTPATVAAGRELAEPARHRRSPTRPRPARTPAGSCASLPCCSATDDLHDSGVCGPPPPPARRQSQSCASSANCCSGLAVLRGGRRASSSCPAPARRASARSRRPSCLNTGQTCSATSAGCCTGVLRGEQPRQAGLHHLVHFLHLRRRAVARGGIDAPLSSPRPARRLSSPERWEPPARTTGSTPPNAASSSRDWSACRSQAPRPPTCCSSWTTPAPWEVSRRGSPPRSTASSTRCTATTTSGPTNRLEPFDFHLAMTTTSVFYEPADLRDVPDDLRDVEQRLRRRRPAAAPARRCASRRPAPTGGAAAERGFSCKATCAGHAGEAVCCDAAGTTLETTNVACTTPGATCGEIQNRYAFNSGPPRRAPRRRQCTAAPFDTCTSTSNACGAYPGRPVLRLPALRSTSERLPGRVRVRQLRRADELSASPSRRWYSARDPDSSASPASRAWRRRARSTRRATSSGSARTRASSTSTRASTRLTTATGTWDAVADTTNDDEQPGLQARRPQGLLRGEREGGDVRLGPGAGAPAARLGIAKALSGAQRDRRNASGTIVAPSRAFPPPGRTRTAKLVVVYVGDEDDCSTLAGSGAGG